MPSIDLSVVLTSPYLCDNFSVLRRTVSVGSDGRNQITSSTTLPGYGVVQAVSPDALERNPEEQHMTKTISVSTILRLRGPSPGYMPDIVQWHGDNYVVTNVGDYTGFGTGFVVATCASVDTIDQPPP